MDIAHGSNYRGTVRTNSKGLEPMRAPISALVILLLNSALADEGCEFKFWSDYEGDRLFINEPGDAYAFRSSHVRLDADGAPNAYHPDDIGLHCTADTEFKGLDCPANAGYPNTDWWTSVLAKDPDEPTKAYVQSQGEFSGFFVSKTSLNDTNILDSRNPNRYVDATSIPYFVFPGNFYQRRGTGYLGDLGYAINVATGDKSAFVIGDIGPPTHKLGEISLRLAEALGGDSPNARTGEGSPSGEILYIIFPYSSDSFPWPLSPSEIERIGSQLLEDIGGFDPVAACVDSVD